MKRRGIVAAFCCLALVLVGAGVATPAPVSTDSGAAIQWLLKAAEQGNAKAQFYVGALFAQGQGVAQDYAEAVRWWRRAAEQGDARAQYGLGALYGEGRGVPRDDAEMARWWRNAAEGGNPGARYGLGALYAKGRGVPRDYTETARWWRKAAEQGNALAQYSLGALYARGEGVAQDPAETAHWWQEAAEQGEPRAQYGLAALHVKGQGVAEDLVLAYKWFDLAANGESRPAGLEVQGVREKAAEGREALANVMTSVQIEEAKRLAREFRPVPRAGSGGPSSHPTHPRVSTTIGTGFSVGDHGQVLTSHHLVARAESIIVSLADGRSLEAKVERASKVLDLAVLKVNATTSDYLKLAAPGAARVGDRVFTLGYPAVPLLGSEPKFSEGTVSALSGPGGEATLLQVSVPVQPGNSGGPLVNEQGEVVGIITSTASVLSFASATGSLPQNINWAVNAGFATPLYQQPRGAVPTPGNRTDAIERVRKALCLIQAMK